MSKLTVQAIDSAAAMEEIVSKLGPDAVILSTTKVNGKVVMEASTGTLQNQNRSAEDKKFSDIFSQKMTKSFFCFRGRLPALKYKRLYHN